jgi:hypothetical protein
VRTQEFQTHGVLSAEMLHRLDIVIEEARAVDSTKVVLSPPAHHQVTPSVRVAYHPKTKNYCMHVLVETAVRAAK